MKETSTQIRLKKVIQFINKHPNCTTEEITLGVSIKGERPITVRTIQNDLKYLRGNWKDGKPRDTILSSPSLSYLVDAICHVTEPLTNATSDEYNGS